MRRKKTKRMRKRGGKCGRRRKRQEEEKMGKREVGRGGRGERRGRVGGE